VRSVEQLVIDTLADLGLRDVGRILAQRGSIAGGETGDVAEQDHIAQLRRQLVDRRPDPCEHLPAEQAGLGQALPVVGQRGPASLRVEAIRVDDRLAARLVAAEEGGEGQQSRFPPAAGARHVEEDPEDPGLERRPALESVEPGEHSEPGLLDGVLGGIAIPEVAHREPEERPVVALEQRCESGFVAGLEGFQLRVAAQPGHARQRIVPRASGPEMSDQGRASSA